MRRRGVVVVVAGALLCGGCGGDDGAEEPAAKRDRPERPPTALPADVVARVGTVDITKATARHWIDAARKQAVASDAPACKGKDCREQAMQFLISAQWLLQKAAESRVEATDAEVRKTFDKQKREAFPRERDYRRFVKRSGRTEADLLFQVKLSVLTNKLQRAITGRGGKKGQQQARLEVFVERFQKTFKRQTVCRREYASKDQCGRIVD